MIPTAISLLSDEDLIDELMSRYDQLIFAAQRETNHQPGKVVATRQWKGDYATAMGLCTQMWRKISDEHEHVVEEHSSEDVEDD